MAGQSQTDEEWFREWAEKHGKSPTDDDVEAFAERVAIMLEGSEDARRVHCARVDAAWGWAGCLN